MYKQIRHVRTLTGEFAHKNRKRAPVKHSGTAPAACLREIHGLTAGAESESERKTVSVKHFAHDKTPQTPHTHTTTGPFPRMSPPHTYLVATTVNPNGTRPHSRTYAHAYPGLIIGQHDMIRTTDGTVAHTHHAAHHSHTQTHTTWILHQTAACAGARTLNDKPRCHAVVFNRSTACFGWSRTRRNEEGWGGLWGFARTLLAHWRGDYHSMPIYCKHSARISDA